MTRVSRRLRLRCGPGTEVAPSSVTVLAISVPSLLANEVVSPTTPLPVVSSENRALLRHNLRASPSASRNRRATRVTGATTPRVGHRTCSGPGVTAFASPLRAWRAGCASVGHGSRWSPFRVARLTRLSARQPPPPDYKREPRPPPVHPARQSLRFAQTPRHPAPASSAPDPGQRVAAWAGGGPCSSPPPPLKPHPGEGRGGWGPLALSSPRRKPCQPMTAMTRCVTTSQPPAPAEPASRTLDSHLR